MAGTGGLGAVDLYRWGFEKRVSRDGNKRHLAGRDESGLRRSFHGPIFNFAQERDGASPRDVSGLRRKRAEAALTGIEIRAKAPGAQTPTGRYVRVQGVPRQLIHLAEVEVYSGGTNVARNGKASQSTTGYGGEAARAIDGNTSGEFANNSVSHTAEADPEPILGGGLGQRIPAGKGGSLESRTDGLEESLAHGCQLGCARRKSPRCLFRENEMKRQSPRRNLTFPAGLVLT